MTALSLYALTPHDGNVSIQRPTRLRVRATDGSTIDRTVARVTVGPHGGIVIEVAHGVVVTELTEVDA